MEEQKLLKRKRKALSGSNRKHLAEICLELGDYYNGKMRYESALKEYTESASIYRELDFKLENAKSHRMIGEMYMLLAEFENALIHGDIYLSVVRELDNKVEEQRALATLGRAFLLQGQSLGETDEAKKSLKAAEKSFMKSLVLCESLKSKVNNRELMDMRARLLLNIGVVLEQLEIFDRAVEFLQKAISICKTQDLYDLLNQCYITEGILYSARQNDNAKALSCFNFALDVAGRLDNKIAKQCEALSMKADALCKMSDFYSAKSILMKAWKLKTPDADEQAEIERKLKTVAALCYTEDLLVTSDSNDHETMKKLYEKLGDGACSLRNYQKGVDCYMKMLEHAEKNGDTGKQLVPIYVSLYQSYKDMKNYKKALVYQKKEFEIIQHDHKEAYTTLINIADSLRLAGESYEEVEKVYQQARELAKKSYNAKGDAKVLRMLIKYNKELKFADKAEQLENELSMMNVALSDESDGEQSSDGDCGDTPNIGDEICLDNLTDISDDDNEENDKPRVARKRGKGFSIKKNSKGETQLHQACISGNTLLVSRLLSQGHPVNVRDNAGWLPLHEACIHGHKDIVEILLENGAHINDRGGTQCDGITPMHDAASNGYLEIVQFLLDKGASPCIKNDHGDTVLDFLKTWRKAESLNPTDQIFYEALCARLHKNLDKVIEVNKKSPFKADNARRKNPKINISEECKNVKRYRECADAYRSPQKRNSLNDSCDSDDSFSLTHKAKNRNIIDCEESSNSSVDKKKISVRYKDAGVQEYKNAMKTLRNRHNVNDTDSDQEKQKDTEKRKKGAFMEPQEVGDDWLEEDMKQSHHSKKRKRQKNQFSDTVKRKSNDSIKSLLRDDILNDHEMSHSGRVTPETDVINSYGFVENHHPDGLCESDSNSMDADIMHRENIPPMPVDCRFGEFVGGFSPEKVFKEKKHGKRWKHQSTLIKSGFTRNKSDRSKVHSTSLDSCVGSDTETASNVSLTSVKSLRNFNECSEEPDSTTEQSQQNSFDRMKTTNSLGAKSSHFPRTPSFGSFLPSQPPAPPAAVRVRVQEKLLLIPVSLDKIDSLTIGWFSKEVSRRYYNIEGVQPSLNLLMCDGAILADEDPLSLVIGPTELQASITSWNLPPVGDRYIECCAQFKIDIDEHIRSVLESSQATHSVSLPNLNLSPTDMQPLFKSLNHQISLTHLILPNNALGNEGVKHLAQCLPTLPQIRHINLSGNCIDAEGVKNLLFSFEKPNTLVLPNALELDLSFNLLGDSGFRHVMTLANLIRLKSLNLKACDITWQTLENTQEVMNLGDLEVINLGLNSFSRNFLRLILISLNPQIISVLRLEGLNVNGEFVASFMDNCAYTSLRELDLSRCDLTDADVTQILRSLSKCEDLQTIKLRYNPELTILSLKKLVQCFPSFTNIDLEGCGQIFKYFQESDMRGNWFRECEECKIKSLIITADISEEGGDKLLEQFSHMWINKWEDNAFVDRGMYGQVHLTTNL